MKAHSNRYNAIHKWMTYNYGRADRCDSPDCNKKSTWFDWALIKGFQHERKRDNYMMLCRSCHLKYDYTEYKRKRASEVMKQRAITHNPMHTESARKKTSERMKNFRHSDETKKKLSTPVIDSVTGEEFVSIQKAAERLGVTREWLGKMLKGVYKNTTPMVYKSTFNGTV